MFLSGAAQRQMLTSPPLPDAAEGPLLACHEMPAAFRFPAADYGHHDGGAAACVTAEHRERVILSS